jgi:hypothetical protein
VCKLDRQKSIDYNVFLATSSLIARRLPRVMAKILAWLRGWSYPPSRDSTIHGVRLVAGVRRWDVELSLSSRLGGSPVTEWLPGYGQVCLIAVMRLLQHIRLSWTWQSAAPQASVSLAKAQRRPSHTCSFEGTVSLTVARSFVSAVSCRCTLGSSLQRNAKLPVSYGISSLDLRLCLVHYFDEHSF